MVLFVAHDGIIHYGGEHVKEKACSPHDSSSGGWDGRCTRVLISPSRAYTNDPISFHQAPPFKSPESPGANRPRTALTTSLYLSFFFLSHQTSLSGHFQNPIPWQAPTFLFLLSGLCLLEACRQTSEESILQRLYPVPRWPGDTGTHTNQEVPWPGFRCWHPEANT